MKFAKTLAFFYLSIFAATAFPMNHFAGKVNPSKEDKDLKWTTAKWYDNGDFETKALPSKPGPNDNTTLRWGSYKLTVDCDVNIASFSIGDDSKLICNKRNFKTKRNFNLAISPYGESRAEFTGSNVDIGGSLSYSFYEKHTKASYANFKATDSKINIKNDLTVIIPFNGRVKNPAKRGGKIELEGKTTMSFGNGTVIDSLIKDMPTEWMFRFIFREKDGNIPTISFEKEANLDGCEFEFDIKNAKPGTYTLIRFDNKKSGIGKPNKVMLNGKDYAFGSEFKIGNKSAKIMLAPSPNSKDTRTPNDLILQISK